MIYLTLKIIHYPPGVVFKCAYCQFCAIYFLPIARFLSYSHNTRAHYKQEILRILAAVSCLFSCVTFHGKIMQRRKFPSLCPPTPTVSSYNTYGKHCVKRGNVFLFVLFKTHRNVLARYTGLKCVFIFLPNGK